MLTGATRSGPGKAYRALGRMKAGRMNRTETRYAAVLEARRASGEVFWWAFQAIKLRLADNTHLTPDFAVLPSTGVFEFHDTKGAKHLIEEDANAKMKIAGEVYPFRFFFAWPSKAGVGGFEVVEVGG
ncbi:DUF1064 domain-containing protein [Methylobacterium haplocladii]|uniref:DUF1064 domain-containing protein n=1 Tax=Methylobacterium haplocladii TaxID=1176176 RepID=UPI001AED7A98|nr:DUF1064 domain-containing protein [Methylobacterium haplocladii]